MGKFVKKMKIEVEYDGDTLCFECEPMKKAVAVAMQAYDRVPVLRDGAPVLKDGAQVFTIADAGLEYMMDQFAEHVTAIAGARDADGNAVDRDTILGTAYFIAAVSDASGEWIARSLSGNSQPSAR